MLGPVIIWWDLRDEHPIGFSGQGREKGEEATVATHDFKDEATLVRGCCGDNSVGSLNDTMEGRVGANGHVGAAKVVVDGPNDADDVELGITSLLVGGNEFWG